MEQERIKPVQPSYEGVHRIYFFARCPAVNLRRILQQLGKLRKISISASSWLFFKHFIDILEVLTERRFYKQRYFASKMVLLRVLAFLVLGGGLSNAWIKMSKYKLFNGYKWKDDWSLSMSKGRCVQQIHAGYPKCSSRMYTSSMFFYHTNQKNV